MIPSHVFLKGLFKCVRIAPITPLSRGYTLNIYAHHSVQARIGMSPASGNNTKFTMYNCCEASLRNLASFTALHGKKYRNNRSFGSFHAQPSESVRPVRPLLDSLIFH